MYDGKEKAEVEQSILRKLNNCSKKKYEGEINWTLYWCRKKNESKVKEHKTKPRADYRQLSAEKLDIWREQEQQAQIYLN